MDVPEGERGQVVMNRLDETQLIVNLMERDEAERLAPPRGPPRMGSSPAGYAILGRS